MKNMKKALCLIMAMVFVLGLCTVGAGAATAPTFSDVKQINSAYKDAVTVMSGLGIIAGYPDGTFQPLQNVTRAEAAKLVTYMVLGAKNAERLPEGDGGFSDVAGNWASKYINYCSSKGFIKGMGDGTFNPGGNIKGTELAALLLRVLGYGVMGEYEGKGWDINAVSDAMAKGVFAETETADFGAPATREETALYFFNTLTDVQIVGYDVDKNYYDGKTYKATDYSYSYDMNGNMTGYTPTTVDRNETYGHQIFDLASIKAQNANGYQVIGNQATGEKYTVVSRNPGSGNKLYLDYETGLDLIAHEVSIYIEDKTKTDADGNYYYTTYLVEDASTVVDKGSYYGELYKNLNKAYEYNDNVDLSKVNVWENYTYVVTPSEASPADLTATPPKEATYHYLSTDSGYAYPIGMKDKFTASTLFLSGNIILGSNGKIISYTRNDFFIGQVDRVGEVIKLKSSSVEIKPENAYEGIAKNDYVKVEKRGKIYVATETFTKTIEVTDAPAGIFAGWFNGFSVSPSRPTSKPAIPGFVDDYANVAAGDTVELYMDGASSYFAVNIISGTQAGAVYVVDTYERAADDGYDNVSGAPKAVYAQCVNEKGEEVIYKLADSYTLTSSKALIGNVYKVRINPSNNRATMVATEDGVNLQKAKGYTSYLTADAGTPSGTYYVTSDTKVIYLSSKSGTGTATQADLKIELGKLTSEQPKINNIAGYSVKSGNSNNIQALWITTSKPAAYEDSYMFIGWAPKVYPGTTFDITDPSTYGNAYYGMSPSGTRVVDGEETFYYSSVYIDGKQPFGGIYIAQDGVYAGGDPKAEPGVITTNNSFTTPGSGFYKYEIDENNIYTIERVTDSAKVRNIGLKEGNINNGRLYVDADGVDISNVQVINVSGDFDVMGSKANDGSNFYTIESVEDIETLLADGKTVTVQYIRSTSTGKPITPIYVTGVA